MRYVWTAVTILVVLVIFAAIARNQATFAKWTGLQGPTPKTA